MVCNSRVLFWRLAACPLVTQRALVGDFWCGIGAFGEKTTERSHVESFECRQGDNLHGFKNHTLVGLPLQDSTTRQESQ